MSLSLFFAKVMSHYSCDVPHLVPHISIFLLLSKGSCPLDSTLDFLTASCRPPSWREEIQINDRSRYLLNLYCVFSVNLLTSGVFILVDVPHFRHRTRLELMTIFILKVLQFCCVYVFSYTVPIKVERLLPCLSYCFTKFPSTFFAYMYKG